jgi:hypothetical protein
MTKPLQMNKSATTVNISLIFSKFLPMDPLGHYALGLQVSGVLSESEYGVAFARCIQCRPSEKHT